MSELLLKYCSACGEEKPATTEFFHRHTKMKDGLRHQCKVCINTPLQSYVVPEEGICCTQCGEKKPATVKFFQRDRLMKDGLRHRCKDCLSKSNQGHKDVDRANFHKRKFRINNPHRNSLTFEDYNLIAFQQCNLCAICGQPETILHPRTNKAISLSVDHNHETGQVRELLCNKCNVLLGYIEKDQKRVKKMIKYLKKWEGLV